MGVSQPQNKFVKVKYFFQPTKLTSCLGPNDITIGSAETRAGWQSLIALCKSFRWPHLGCLNNPENGNKKWEGKCGEYHF